MIGTSDQSCWLAEACKILLLLLLRRWKFYTLLVFGSRRTAPTLLHSSLSTSNNLHDVQTALVRREQDPGSLQLIKRC